MKVKNLLTGMAVLTILSVLLPSCAKDSSGAQQISVFLTDGPASYDAVNVEILAVEVKVDSSAGHELDDHRCDNDDDRDDHLRSHDEFGSWTSLPFTPQVFNLLDLNNGIDALLGTTTVGGTVRKIRLTLGTNNTIVKDGVTYPLSLINPTQNFLYVHLYDRDREHHNNGTAISVWVDFDVARSIIENNGQFFLRPVLRPFCDDNFAEIEGRVLPAAAQAVVRVYNNTDTAVAIPNPDGYFKVRGLAGGTYTVQFDATSPYQDTTVNNVISTIGQEAHLQTITLRQ